MEWVSWQDTLTWHERWIRSLLSHHTHSTPSGYQQIFCALTLLQRPQPFELGAPTEQPPAPVPSPALPGFFQPIPAVLKTMSKGLAIHNFYPHEKANSSGSQSHISPFERGSKPSFQVQNLLFCGFFFPYESDSLHSCTDRCFCCVIQLTMDIMYFVSRCWVLHFLRAATICLWLEVWLFK